MLSAAQNEGHLDRTFRNREQLVVCVIAVAVFNMINLAAIADGVDGVAFLAGRIASSIALTVFGLRTAFSSLVTTRTGIQVSNPFSHFFLEWSEIERFEIGRWKFLPSVCLIHLGNGRKMHATGIQEARIGDHSAAYMVDDLNAELARRTQMPASPSPPL